MQEIDLGDEVHFKIKYKGKEYVLREPTVAEIEGIKDAGDGFNSVKFLATLGLPENVTKELGISKLNKVVESMLDLVGKKK